MTRLASPLLAAAVLAASAGMAFAANAPAAAQPPAAATASPAPHVGDHARPTQSKAAGDRMTAALNLLEAKGYGGFSDFKPSGKDFAATVNENGQHFTVTVDPDSGQVTRQG
jgi:hypothetical protein